MADRFPVTAFFDKETYCRRNPIPAVRARLVAELLDGIRHKSILDLGCGDGSVSAQFTPESELTLVDFSEAMLERARHVAPRARRIHADVMEWRPDQEFDVVLAIGLLAHVSMPERLVEKVAASTRSGGCCILQITDTDALLGWALTRYGRIRRHQGYRVHELGYRQLLGATSRQGLVPIACRRYGLLLPGTGWLPFG